MAIEDNINAILIKYVFQLNSHALRFSVMCHVGAVPWWVPCSYQPRSHISVNISQIFLQPVILVPCYRKTKNLTVVTMTGKREIFFLR